MARSIALAHGNLAYARAGEGPVVLLLHQTPRSSDEYRDVLPLLAAGGLQAFAFDTPGFGASAPLPGEPTIERWAQTVLDGLNALEIAGASVSGVELRTSALTDAAYRAQPPDESGVDAAEDAEGLRRSRAGFYPEDRPDLLDRYVTDAVKAGPLAQIGHRAVGKYEMDRALARLEMPTLLIGATEDPFAHPQLARLHAALPNAEVTEIAGGMVPLPDGWPEAFAAAVGGFLSRVVPGVRR